MAFHVFVEGATDDTLAGVQRLADAIAQHYGLPAADLLARLQKGRFRVKGNIDRDLADTYRRDLERLGARCVIEAANAESSARAAPVPLPAARPGTPPAGASAPAARASQQYHSGLAAAFSSTRSDAPASLGALDSDNGSFALASVDGADSHAVPSAGSSDPSSTASLPGTLPASIGPPPSNARPASVGPRPPSTLPASIGPAREKSTPVTSMLAKAERPKDVPLDLFAPPDAQDAQLAVDIADDEPPRRKSEPVIPASVATAESLTRRSPPSRVAASPPVTAVRGRLGPLGDLRVRFAAGVLLALLVGFVPAHLVASMREASAYQEVDQKVVATQQLADTPDAYAQLDNMRADQLERKRGEQRNIAILALAIWALVGSAFAFAWFKKVPWERFE